MLFMNQLEVIGGDFAVKDVSVEVSQGGVYKNTKDAMDIIEAYLETLNSKHTVRQYKKSICDFLIHCYGTEFVSATDLVVNPVKAVGYESSIKALLDNGEIKTATFNAKIKGVKHFYDWLMTQTTLNTHDVKVFNINPFSSVKQRSENDAEGSEPLSPEEVMTMLENPFGMDEHIQQRNILLLEIAISTGIRLDALLSITRDNLKIVDGKKVISTRDKNGKEAIKPITHYYDELLEWYEEDIKWRESGSNTIFGIHPHSANRIVKEWAIKVGIDKKITFHSLRTTTAVQIYHLTDGNLGRTQDALNHSNASTTRRYIMKERRINCDAENIVENIKNTSENFDNFVKELSKEELLEMLLNLDTVTKLKIMNER